MFWLAGINNFRPFTAKLSSRRYGEGQPICVSIIFINEKWDYLLSTQIIEDIYFY